jgi:hypothetical protein
VHQQHQQQAPIIRVVLAEDGVLLREGLAGLLQRFGFHVAEMAGTPRGCTQPSRRTSRTW